MRPLATGGDRLRPIRPRGTALPQPSKLLRLAVTVYVPLGALGVALAVWKTGAIPGRALEPGRALADVALGLAVALVIVALSHWGARAGEPLRRLEQEFRALLGPLRLREILVLALLSGVAEEAFFRGVLQPWIGYLGASLIFGLAHFPVNRTFIPWTIFATVAGFVFGALADMRASLVAPIVAHVLVNALNLARIVRLPERPIAAIEEP